MILPTPKTAGTRRQTMNKFLKSLIPVVLTVGVIFTLTACKARKNPYNDNAKEGYTVNVRYDANGGSFATNTSVIVDSYNPDNFADGKITLFAPDDSNRKNPYTAQNTGFILAGWYTEREPVVDENGNHLDYDGNIAAETGLTPAYTFSGHWDFASDKLDLSTLEGDTVTLYAAWVPEFTFEFYYKSGDDLVLLKSEIATVGKELTLPALDTKSGKVNANDFPTLVGMTYNVNGIYLDSEFTVPVTGKTLTHSGTIDPSTAEAENGVMKIYLDTLMGDWYWIDSAEQLIANANPSGHYVIGADLDFDGKKWPLSSNFSGSIHGNGYTISNISIEQNKIETNSVYGIFKTVKAGAEIKDVNFANAKLSILQGNSKPNISYGLFAGKIEAGVTISNVTLSGEIVISANAYNGVANGNGSVYAVGLVAGVGYENCSIDYSNIVLTALDDSDTVVLELTSNGNTVTWIKNKKS